MTSLLTLLAILASGGAPETSSLMLAQARTMSTDALARALLPSPHPAIVESFVHPIGMEAPMPWVTGVDLVSAPRTDIVPGFCTADVFKVAFEATQPTTPRFNPVPARPTGITVDTVYRLPSDGARPSAASCKSSLEGYFHASPAERPEVFRLMRMLAEDKEAMRRNGKLPFAVTFLDQMSDEFDRLASQDPERAKEPPVVKRLTTPFEALTELPLSRTYAIELAPSDPDIGLKQGNLVAHDGTRLSTARILSGGEWVADVAYHGTAIDRMHILRRIPPPF